MKTEILFYVTDDLLNKSVSRISKNAECPFTTSSRDSHQAIASRLFFTSQLCGGLGFFGIFGLKNFSWTSNVPFQVPCGEL